MTPEKEPINDRVIKRPLPGKNVPPKTFKFSKDLLKNSAMSDMLQKHVERQAEWEEAIKKATNFPAMDELKRISNDFDRVRSSLDYVALNDLSVTAKKIAEETELRNLAFQKSILNSSVLSEAKLMSSAVTDALKIFNESSAFNALKDFTSCPGLTILRDITEMNRNLANQLKFNTDFKIYDGMFKASETLINSAVHHGISETLNVTSANSLPPAKDLAEIDSAIAENEIQKLVDSFDDVKPTISGRIQVIYNRLVGHVLKKGACNPKCFLWVKFFLRNGRRREEYAVNILDLVTNMEKEGIPKSIGYAILSWHCFTVFLSCLSPSDPNACYKHSEDDIDDQE